MQWGCAMNSAVFLAKGEKDPHKKNEDFAYVVPGMFYAVADGYWGHGRVASHLAPVLFHRQLEERLASQELTPENALDFFQLCVDGANEELKTNTLRGYTTLSAAVIHKGQLYAFTLGDSVVFGYDGTLHLLTEPQSVLYPSSENRGDSSVFEKYCISDDGTQRPRNFMGLPSPDIPGEGKPTIRQLHVSSIEVYHSLLLVTDGLTSLVLPEEIERACHEREPDRVVGSIERMWRNPEQLIYHLLAELYAPTTDASVQQQVKALIQQQGINPNQTPQQVYDALQQNVGAFQTVAQYCLNYPHRGSVRKPRDDTVVLYVELHPSQRPSVGALHQRIAGLEKHVVTLQTAITDYERQLGELRGQLVVQTTRATTAEAKLSGLETSLAAETQRARQTLEANRALQEQTNRTEKDYSQQLGILREELQQITSARASAEQALEQSRAQYSLLETQVAGLRTTATTATDAQVAAERKFKDLERDYDELDQQCTQLRESESSYLARISQLETQLSVLSASQKSGSERERPQKKSSWFSKLFKYSAIATVGAATVGILSCGGLVYWIWPERTPTEQYSQVEQIPQSVSPPVAAELVNTEEVLPVMPVNIIPPTPEPVIELPVVPEPTLDSVVHDSSLTVCVTKDGTMGDVVNPEIREAYAFQSTTNEPDMKKKVTCDGEIVTLSPSFVLFYYVNGLQREDLSDFTDGIYAWNNRIGDNKIPLVQLLVNPSIEQIMYCDSWYHENDPTNPKQGSTWSPRCDKLENFILVHKADFDTAIRTGPNDRIMLTQGGQE
jgi:serine/threonine protein phosphatase PrpC/phage shock protein A